MFPPDTNVPSTLLGLAWETDDYGMGADERTRRKAHRGLDRKLLSGRRTDQMAHSARMEKSAIASLHQLVTCSRTYLRSYAAVFLGRAQPSCDGLLPESSSGYLMARRCTNPLGPGVAG